MYKAAPDHPKFATFKSLAKLSKAAAVGNLELLWHFAGRFALAGNVGRFSDAEIEASLEWEGAAGALIEALISSRWLDRSAVHRLVVHDWSQWADENVHTQLARKGERFADGAVPRSGRLNQAERLKFVAAFTKNEVSGASQNAAEGQPKLSHGSGPTQPHSADATVPVPLPIPAPVPARTKTTSLVPPALSTQVVDESLLVLEPPEKRKRTPEEYVAFWNKERGTLASVVPPLSASRRTKLQTRIGRGLTPTKLKEVLTKIHQTPYCLGDNASGWRVTFDFLIANDDNIAKILGGNYDRPSKKPTVAREYMATSTAVRQ
ncbi:hypothetical protein [Granulicella sp. S190]|uniref:hypothetical protein n=1 Tax=Granulicella sp. S190 TaxID=1747226 RepID=UPI00131D9618|nr:hypothetical protein [Granulicella sp. S190]